MQSMFMAVDIGNTNIVLGFLQGTRTIGTYRITTKAAHTSDEYGLMITHFLSLHGLSESDVEQVVIASVVPQVMHSFTASIMKFLHITPLIVGPGIKTGINVRIDEPRTLGADCLADCAGAYYCHTAPALVADFGTATTFNYITARGEITCGLIAPGIQTSAASLWQGTAQLPEIELVQPTSIIATNTAHAMQAGIFYNALGGIERIIEQFKREIQEDFTVIATGGLGRMVAQSTNLIDVYDPDLMFKGMAAIARKNQ